MYTVRHHLAGRTIPKAILSGERATEVAYTDVGSKANMTKDQLPAKDHSHNIRLPKQSTRLDIILATRRTEGGAADYKQITIVEIKYCQDTDHQQQLDRAPSPQEQTGADPPMSSHSDPHPPRGIRRSIQHLHSRGPQDPRDQRQAPQDHT